MKVLALDLSSEMRSVAVVDGSGQKLTVLGECVHANFREKTVMTLISELLNDLKIRPSEIEMVAVGLGPGSYTGIRISLAIAQGWQLANGSRSAGASSSAAIAEAVYAQGVRGEFDVLIDAQRDELYMERYSAAGELKRSEELQILPLEKYKTMRARVAAGPEVQRWEPAGLQVFPRAANVALLALRQGKLVSAETLQPIYLRETSFVKVTPPAAVIHRPAN